MQVVNWHEHEKKRMSSPCGDMVAYAMLHALVEYEKAQKRKGLPVAPTVDIKENGGKWDSTRVEVEFKMNGVDMDFEEFMDCLDKGCDVAVERKASELLEERLTGAVASLSDTVREVKAWLKKYDPDNPEYDPTK